MAIASECEVWWSVEKSLLHVYKTAIWNIGDLICCDNRMSSRRPDLDTKGIPSVIVTGFTLSYFTFKRINYCYLMSSPLSFGLTIDILEHKEMSFVCFCVPCDFIVVIEEALILIWLAWLAASYMQ